MRKIKIILMMFLTVFVFILSGTLNVVNADDFEVLITSGVLEDLKKDDTFDINNYPSLSYDEIKNLNSDDDENNDKKLLDVIQIAESKNNELAIYVYNPTADTLELTASKINIAIDPETKSYNVYDLVLLDREGLFSKYLVRDFIVDSNKSVRYYDISNIFRVYDVNIDGEPLDTNIISFIGEGVGKLWTVHVINNDIIYDMTYEKWIKITISYFGSIRYKTWSGVYGFGAEPKKSISGATLGAGMTMAVDSHYVCFSTDKQMDKLLEAEVYFESTPLGTSYSWNYGGGQWKKDPNKNKVIVTDPKGNNGVVDIIGGWLYDDYSYNRIVTVSEFLELEKSNLDDVTIDNINKVINNSENTPWCLRYCETDYEMWATGDSSSGNSVLYGVNINNTTLLRLKFITDGVTYNLGVVDNMTSSDNVPDGVVDLGPKVDSLKELIEKMFLILGIIILIILFINLFTPITTLLKVIGQAFLFVLKLLLLPFKLIGSLFKKKKY